MLKLLYLLKKAYINWNWSIQNWLLCDLLLSSPSNKESTLAWGVCTMLALKLSHSWFFCFCAVLQQQSIAEKYKVDPRPHFCSLDHLFCFSRSNKERTFAWGVCKILALKLVNLWFILSAALLERQSLATKQCRSTASLVILKPVFCLSFYNELKLSISCPPKK